MYKYISIEKAKLTLGKIIEEVEKDDSLEYVITVEGKAKAIIKSIEGVIAIEQSDVFLGETIAGTHFEV